MFIHFIIFTMFMFFAFLGLAAFLIGHYMKNNPGSAMYWVGVIKKLMGM